MDCTHAQDLVLDELDGALDAAVRHELRRHLLSRFGGGDDDDRLQLALISFGYRHGVPKHADIVLDARFLPNPYFDPALKPQSGRDAQVQGFLAGREEYRTFRAKLLDLLDFLLPAYRREGKSYLTIAIGCTGGRHRSVALVEDLADELARRGSPALKTHRDCDRQGT